MAQATAPFLDSAIAHTISVRLGCQISTCRCGCASLRRVGCCTPRKAAFSGGFRARSGDSLPFVRMVKLRLQFGSTAPGENYNRLIFWNGVLHMRGRCDLRPCEGLPLVRHQRRNGEWAGISCGPLWNFLWSILWGDRVRRLVALGDSGRGLCLCMRLQSVQFFQRGRSANVREIGRGEIPRTTGMTRQRQVMKSFHRTVEGRQNGDLQDV